MTFTTLDPRPDSPPPDLDRAADLIARMVDTAVPLRGCEPAARAGHVRAFMIDGWLLGHVAPGCAGRDNTEAIADRLWMVAQ